MIFNGPYLQCKNATMKGNCPCVASLPPIIKFVGTVPHPGYASLKTNISYFGISRTYVLPTKGLQRRLYRIYTVYFLMYNILCNSELVSFVAMSINSLRTQYSRKKTQLKLVIVSFY